MMNMNSILKIEFDAVMSYDDWTIFRYKDKYYVADEFEIKEVELFKKTKAVSQEEFDETVNLGCDYCGQSDDMEYYLWFNLKG